MSLRVPTEGYNFYKYIMQIFQIPEKIDKLISLCTLLFIHFENIHSNLNSKSQLN